MLDSSLAKNFNFWDRHQPQPSRTGNARALVGRTTSRHQDPSQVLTGQTRNLQPDFTFHKINKHHITTTEKIYSQIQNVSNLEFRNDILSHTNLPSIKIRWRVKPGEPRWSNLRTSYKMVITWQKRRRTKGQANEKLHRVILLKFIGTGRGRGRGRGRGDYRVGGAFNQSAPTSVEDVNSNLGDLTAPQKNNNKKRRLLVQAARAMQAFQQLMLHRAMQANN
ncbi:hypothetical protein ACFE04_027195 [Oxalis oulophora]